MMQRPRDEAQIVQKRSSHAANIRCYQDIAKFSPKKLQSREAARQWGVSPVATLASGGARAMSAVRLGEPEGVPGGVAASCEARRTQRRCETRPAERRAEVLAGTGRRGRQAPTSRAWLFTFVKCARKSLIPFGFGKIHVFCVHVLLNVARFQGSASCYYKCKAGLYKCKAGILQM